MPQNQFDVNRRTFVARTALAAGATTLGGGMFDALVARAQSEARVDRREGVGYGPLRPAGDDLALPPGFQYRVLSTEGDEMTDGFPVPKAMDGMGAFPLPNGNVLLVRNCEDNEDPNRLRPRPSDSTSTSAGILNDILDTHYGRRDDHARGRGARPARARLAALEPRRNAAQLRRWSHAVGQLALMRGDAVERIADGDNRVCTRSRLLLRSANRHGPWRARRAHGAHSSRSVRS
jgi:Alkaline phosphatase PhoX